MTASFDAVYRDPFVLGSPTVTRYPVGTSIEAMVVNHPSVPKWFATGGEVRIDGVLVPRPLWASIKPKAPANVTLHAPIQGGSGGRKQIGALVATLALTVATQGILSGAIAGGLTGATATATTTLATGLAAGTALAGSLLIAAVFQPPSRVNGSQSGIDRDKNGAASVQGNLLEANAPLPRVIGTRKVFPPLAAQPFAFYDGDDEVVEAVFVLAGPHKIEDIRLDDVLIEDAEDVEIEVREGWTDDIPVTFAQRQVVNSESSIELSTHRTLDDKKDRIESPEDVPVFHPFVIRDGVDFANMQIELPQGLSVDGNDTISMFVPFRLRIRKKGDVSWRNMPELHYSSPALIQTRTTIRFEFRDEPQPFDPTFGLGGWIEARRSTVAQTDTPGFPAWVADTYFSSGISGDAEYMSGQVTTTSGVRNVTLSREMATFHLDRAEFTAGEYEVEVKRGLALRRSDYSASAYTYKGAVRDFFQYRGDADGLILPMSRSNVIDNIVVIRVASVWEDDPVKRPGFAKIAVRARNRAVSNLSAVASGYVKDWDGSSWVTWTTTSNPAPHYNDVLRGQFNLDPVPESIVDNDSLVEWRTACAAAGHEVNHVAEGDRIDDLLRIIAGVGFARPYNAEVWGVVRDSDRTAEPPIQIFTPRNSAGFKWTKAFGRRAAGLRVNYQTERDDQIVVFLDEVDESRLEQITYEGITDPAKAAERALYDLGQAKYRSTFYEFVAPAESIVCRRGSLIGAQHDTIYHRAGSGRILEVIASDGNVTGVRIDGDVEVMSTAGMNAVTDMSAVANMSDVGVKTAAAIRNTDGTITVHPLSNVTGLTDTLVFETPVVNATTAGGPFDEGVVPLIDHGCVVAVGPRSQEFRRMIVFSITPRPDHSATIVAVDEAPQLWT